MKCDELKAETIVPQGSAITLQMYGKAEVDEAIAELKDKVQQKDFFWEGCAFAKRGFKNTIDVSEYVETMENLNDELRKENKDIKDKLRHYPMMAAIIESDKKELAELREATRWHECNEDGTPKEDYDGQDWVLVKFREKTTGFQPIPRIAEFRWGTRKWYPIYECDDSAGREYFDDFCVVVSWRLIEPITKAPEVK